MMCTNVQLLQMNYRITYSCVAKVPSVSMTIDRSKVDTHDALQLFGWRIFILAGQTVSRLYTASI